MGVVITVNKIKRVPNNFNNVVVGKEEVLLEGSLAIAETKIYNPLKIQGPIPNGKEENVQSEEIENEIDEDFILEFPIDELDEDEDEDVEDDSNTSKNIDTYAKYVLKHSQRYPIVGVLNNKEFKEILRVFSFEVYIDNEVAISYSKHKGKFAHSAFRRLTDTTDFRTEPYELDLILAIEKIIESDSGITINSGWFSNLGLANLDSVLLRGDDVNEAADWNKFKETKGASLSNIELIVEDGDFPNNKISISLSKRGILYCKRNITQEKSIELTNKIFEIVL